MKREEIAGRRDVAIFMAFLSVVVFGSFAAFAFDAQKDRPTPPKRIFGETSAQRDARRAWWTHDRFGLFIHFGLYSVAARHEWMQYRERMSADVYATRYFPRFNPDLFDAKDWARRAKKAGMKYMVLTAKHHEGFCLWDTQTTDFKATKTPFGRDLVREYVEAARAEGLKVGLYYSLIDWHHPDFLVDARHPLRPAKFTDEIYEKLNAGKDWSRYRDYLFAQVRELLSNYGKIDIIWYDYTVKEKYGKNWQQWHAVELLKLTRSLQPGILVDSRLDLMDTEDGWDFVTPEQCRVTHCPQVAGKDAPWETCQTFSGSWGYYRDEETWKSPRQLIELLVNSVAFGGNLILNVGPTGRGAFDSRACDRLDAIGEWMHVNSRSIYGCTAAPAAFKTPVDSLLTYNPETNRLYVHLVNYPMGALPFDFADKVDYAQFLHDGSELTIRRAKNAQDHSQGGDLGRRDFLVLPMKKPAVEIPVIELWLK